MAVGEKMGLVEAAKAAADTGDWASAIELWRNCLAKFSGDRAARHWRASLAKALVNAERLDEAEAEFQTLARVAWDLPDGFVGLARVAEKTPGLAARRRNAGRKA